MAVAETLQHEGHNPAAVIHGTSLPTADNAEFRRLFDKWRLFLFRRVLIRIGYTGKVISPHNGFASTLDVADFAEEHNDFTPADPNIPPPWANVFKKFRESRLADVEHERDQESAGDDSSSEVQKT